MKTFFKTLIASFLGFWLFFLTLCLTAFALLFGLGYLFNEEIKVPDQAALVLNLSFNLPDAPDAESFQDSLMDAFQSDTVHSHHLLELISVLDNASNDNRIKAILLHGNILSANYGSSYPALTELRAALIRFKAKNKQIIAYAETPSLADYFLLSVADKVYMNPFGSLELLGLASEAPYFGSAFNKYGIGVQVSKVGDYKSATEIFTEEKMSDHSREQTITLLNDLWSNIVNIIADNRKIEPSELYEASNTLGIINPEKALQLKLADEIAYWDTVLFEMEQLVGRDNQTKSFNQISLDDYTDHINQLIQKHPFSGNEVAIVYAEGDIVDGEGQQGQVGGNKLARTIRELRNDQNVKALVLRVNSPGGSSYASEVIQRELRLFKEHKPLIVSFGGYAASGGYWISAYSDKIFAEPTTITGSIGVFGLSFNIQKLANDYNVFFDGVKTAPFAGMNTLSRPKTQEELTLIQKEINQIYDAFISKVAEGRNLPKEDVLKIASGHVWSGIEAKNNGLVDEIGGLMDAVHEAAIMAKLEKDWHYHEYPSKTGLLEDLVNNFFNNDSAPASKLKNSFSRFKNRINKDIQYLQSFNDPHGIYAKMPYLIGINETL